ncbi:hypothetical protein FACS1894188_12970 [Clostridia bacterium]|nr:hypothetical protein FACS1894188_12970 [Clostridia bacterium]
MNGITLEGEKVQVIKPNPTPEAEKFIREKLQESEMGENSRFHENIWRKPPTPLTISLALVVAAVLAVGYVFYNEGFRPPTPTDDYVIVPAEPAKIMVYVVGEVVNPDVYEVGEDTRVCDAITLAGGATEDADLFTTLNLAEIVYDTQKIVVPKKIAEGDPPLTESSSTLVNINTADVSQLKTLTDIGEVTARAIVDYRTQNGRFKSIDEIRNVSGIGAKTFEKLKNFITT